MSTFKQQLLDDFVVIELVDTTPTRIKLPDWQRILRGRVVNVGPGLMLPNGSRAPMECQINDVVTFAATAGMDTVFAGLPVRLMHDTDVDAVLP